MPGYLQNVTGGWAGCMYGYMQCTPLDPETSNLWQRHWSFLFCGRANQVCEFGQSVNGGYWPCGNGFIFDPGNSHILVQGNDSEGGLGNMSYFEQWDVCNSNQSQKYIMGQCKDANGTGIGGALISCYVTATNVLESTTYSDSNGYFMAPCPFFPSVAHYLIANDQSGVRAGVTVNTLMPTWRDGT